MVRFLNIILLAILAGLGAWFLYEDELTPADRKILFVGNSYIFGGDVPGMVEAMAASASPPSDYHTRMIAKPDYRLFQHVEEGEAQKELATGIWDDVVLQEQSSGAFTNAAIARMGEGMAALAEAAQPSQTQVLLYAHWPPDFVPAADRAQAIERIERVYADQAQKTGGKVVRIGALWQAAWDDGMTGLYAPDGHHASPLGAYAAALAVLVSLGDVDPATITWEPPGIDPGTAARLRALATN